MDDKKRLEMELKLDRSYFLEDAIKKMDEAIAITDGTGFTMMLRSGGFVTTDEPLMAVIIESLGSDNKFKAELRKMLVTSKTKLVSELAQMEV